MSRPVWEARASTDTSGTESCGRSPEERAAARARRTWSSWGLITTSRPISCRASAALWARFMCSISPYTSGVVW